MNQEFEMSLMNVLDRVLNERGLSEDDALEILKYLTKTSFSDLSQCSNSDIQVLIDYLNCKQKPSYS